MFHCRFDSFTALHFILNEPTYFLVPITMGSGEFSIFTTQFENRYFDNYGYDRPISR